MNAHVEHGALIDLEFSRLYIIMQVVEQLLTYLQLVF